MSENKYDKLDDYMEIFMNDNSSLEKKKNITDDSKHQGSIKNNPIGTKNSNSGGKPSRTQLAKAKRGEEKLNQARVKNISATEMFFNVIVPTLGITSSLARVYNSRSDVEQVKVGTKTFKESDNKVPGNAKLPGLTNNSNWNPGNKTELIRNHTKNFYNISQSNETSFPINEANYTTKGFDLKHTETVRKSKKERKSGATELGLPTNKSSTNVSTNNDNTIRRNISSSNDTNTTNLLEEEWDILFNDYNSGTNTKTENTIKTTKSSVLANSKKSNSSYNAAGDGFNLNKRKKFNFWNQPSCKFVSLYDGNIGFEYPVSDLSSNKSKSNRGKMSYTFNNNDEKKDIFTEKMKYEHYIDNRDFKVYNKGGQSYLVTLNDGKGDYINNPHCFFSWPISQNVSNKSIEKEICNELKDIEFSIKRMEHDFNCPKREDLYVKQEALNLVNCIFEDSLPENDKIFDLGFYESEILHNDFDQARSHFASVLISNKGLQNRIKQLKSGEMIQIGYTVRSFGYSQYLKGLAHTFSVIAGKNNEGKTEYVIIDPDRVFCDKYNPEVKNVKISGNDATFTFVSSFLEFEGASTCEFITALTNYVIEKVYVDSIDNNRFDFCKFKEDLNSGKFYKILLEYTKKVPKQFKEETLKTDYLEEKTKLYDEQEQKELEKQKEAANRLKKLVDNFDPEISEYEKETGSSNSSQGRDDL